MLSVIVAAAATIVQVPAAPAAPSGQAAFDAATKAWEQGRCSEAVPAFDKLADAPAARRNATLAAAIALRRGLCLYRLSRYDEAEIGLRRGVGPLAGQGDAFAVEVRDAYQVMARLALLRLDYEAGIDAAKRALALSKGDDRVVPLILLGTLTRFDGDGEAVRMTAEALQLTQARAGVSKQEIAALQISAARALIAAGRVDDADALLKKALMNNGGLTTRTSLDDVATRYDLAQVALLKKRMDDARLYLAYTGAGRQAETPFSSAAALQAPPCGEVPGMTPDSYAVVEFSLAENGTVVRAEPIYAQGGRDVARAYALAVRGWTWTPEAAKAIPAFYRAVTRVEVRCTRSSQGGDYRLPLRTATAAWLEERGVADRDDDARDADLVARWRTAATGSDAAALDANLRLARSPLTFQADRAPAAARAVALATQLGAPQTVRSQAALIEIDAGSDARYRQDSRRESARREAALRALLARPEVAAESVGAATVRLSLADVYSIDSKNVAPQATEQLAAVADARDLPERHPLRVHALLAQANAAAAKGDLATASTLFARTGLSEQQCALIGPTPTVASSGASSSLYPMELVRMGFEGWARIEYDIAADGRTAGQRTLIAYPPFLFGDAAKAMIGKTRYTRSYRPESSVACAANQLGFRFVLPR